MIQQQSNAAAAAFPCSAALLVLLTGCGGNDGLADVQGRVTDRGEPMPGIVVMYVPDQGGGAPSGGNTNANGEYRLTYSNGRVGAMVGPHTVMISIPEPTGKESKPTTKAGYSTAVQVVEGENQFDFDLSDF
ncbi:carboxypeptidase-like regulatory domain-containing protein [Blastopirellula retiformator]|uniref:Carboxypeptidase regulatory-like domain-containing protein n=1 Tax=Blastopirellula retiformator TaxID=2527970 RepID=A0A5C5V4V3_9BACT|nr:carboxypeptidase-like regulatory domain-containing protein [Blastopirellula retiformator]TWT32999.1 hypothetical protein Enr8_28160 [Blastopirellula retiformator]